MSDQLLQLYNAVRSLGQTKIDHEQKAMFHNILLKEKEERIVEMEQIQADNQQLWDNFTDLRQKCQELYKFNKKLVEERLRLV